MNEIEQDHALDRQLREAAPYIDDNGFTSRILAALPAPATSRENFSLRALILLGVTIISCVLAYVLSGGGQFVTVNVEKVLTLPMMWLFAAALASGVLVTTGGIWAAVFTTRHSTSR